MTKECLVWTEPWTVCFWGEGSGGGGGGVSGSKNLPFSSQQLSLSLIMLSYYCVNVTFSDSTYLSWMEPGLLSRDGACWNYRYGLISGLRLLLAVIPFPRVYSGHSSLFPPHTIKRVGFFLLFFKSRFVPKVVGEEPLWTNIRAVESKHKDLHLGTKTWSARLTTELWNFKGATSEHSH